MLGALIAATAAAPATAWQPLKIGTIQGRLYGSPADGSRPILIVVLHGDAPFEDPTYQYTFAAQVVRAIPGTVVAALLRPGYKDGLGLQSQGTRGLTTGDNYTPEVIDAIDDAIVHLRATYRPARVILVGHSGGAAIAADILSAHPTMAREAILVGCPCDVSGWRSYMMSKRPDPVWNVPVHSISPMSAVGGVSRTARILLIVGQRDDVAPEQFTDEYAAALHRRGIDATVVVAPNLGHNILNEPFVLHQVEQFAAATSPASPLPAPKSSRQKRE